MSLYDEVFSFSNLLYAERMTRKGKRGKKDVIAYEQMLGGNIYDLYERLRKREYTVSPYHFFEIFEPKRREIQALRYEDRIVQRCLMDNYLSELLKRHLIFDNAACRKGKGTDFARNRLKSFLRTLNRKGEVYVLQYDIHHFFESIPHDRLKEKLKRLVSDSEMLSFLFKIIDSFNEESGIGLPMGNQTSQAFALFYLDEIDRLLKECFQVEGYVRYMDDGIALSHSLRLLQTALMELSSRLSLLGLSLNPKKTGVYPAKNGISFLGFRFLLGKNGETYLRIEKKKARRALRYLAEKNSIQSIDTYLSYASRAKERELSSCLKKMRGVLAKSKNG